MKTVNYVVAACAIVVAVLSMNVQGAFLTEAHPTGVASENFLGETTRYSIKSLAPGLSTWGTAVQSVYGASDTGSDWPYVYTPGFDVDNFLSPAGYDLSNGHVSSGLVGGAPGLYNVYITWPASTNVAIEGCRITVSNDGTEVVLDPVDMNTGGTGDPGANHGWYRIAEQVHLTTGTTYTIHQIANNPTAFPSMRSHGVLWELVEADPEMATITESGNKTEVTEGGATDSYTVALKEQPLTDVVVTVEALDPNQLWLNGQMDTILELPFTTANWNQPQPVTVEAYDDLEIENDHSVMVLHMIRPPDPNDTAYGGLVTVNITDNEGPGIRITESDGTTEVSEEGPTSDNYLVKLLYPPTDDVIVNITADDDTLVDTGSGAAQTAQLTFEWDGNWNEEKTVTVSAVDDVELEWLHWSTISHDITSLDGGYDPLPVPDVLVRVEDNECGAWGYLELDINQDCYVDIGDFAELAAAWMECTQPYGTNCVDLR
jgi:hypothetical protein